MGRFDYRVGSTIKYRSFGGEIRKVKVDEKSDDIKNGRPGFGGQTADGGCWGYDDQIVRVVKY